MVSSSALANDGAEIQDARYTQSNCAVLPNPPTPRPIDVYLLLLYVPNAAYACPQTTHASLPRWALPTYPSWNRLLPIPSVPGSCRSASTWAAVKLSENSVELASTLVVTVPLAESNTTATLMVPAAGRSK